MAHPEPGRIPPSPSPGAFATTHWTVVLAAAHTDAAHAARALESLCRSYWYPLYVFVRRQVANPQDAQDLTQEFFARLLEPGKLAKADRQRGKFRTFLLGSLKNFLINEWKRAGRLKRGGDLTIISFDRDLAETRYASEPRHDPSPVHSFERQWAAALIAQVSARLRAEYAAADKTQLFLALKGFIWEGTDGRSYAQIGAQFGLTEGAVKVAVCRLRRRFREVLRAEVANTVGCPEDIDGELRHLIRVLS